MNVSEIIHPAFTDEEQYWCKYRHTYEGGKDFVYRYLEKLSTRESEADFSRRVKLTYSPSFAKAAINEIKNVIFNRLRDVIRESISPTYSKCCNGEMKGVDNAGSTMDYFIGQYVIPELLTMRKVGVYVDMPSEVPKTLAGVKDQHPYLYLYKAESIRSWSYTEASVAKDFESVLLFEDQLEFDSDKKLATGKISRFRHVYLNGEGGVNVEFYDEDGRHIDKNGNPSEIIYKLSIPEVPFVVFEISDSLLKDVADYQIALLNMESADISYAISSNFPLYVEQFDDNINSVDSMPNYTEETDEEITDEKVTEARDEVAKIGTTYGRRYPKNSNQPAFIHPSAEPLKAAMEKEKQIKKDIKLLINLAVNDLTDKMVSAESKAVDESGKQTGLACIAYVLENCELKLANYWANYESLKDNQTRVVYPKDYELKSDEQRHKDCDQLLTLLEKVPSNTFKKEILKRVSSVIFYNKVSQTVIDKIHNEIDKASALITPVELVIKCKDAGLVDDKTASECLGFAEGLVEKAKKDHAETLARIQEAQGGQGGQARGVPQTQMGQRSSSTEKKGKPKRGEAK